MIWQNNMKISEDTAAVIEFLEQFSSEGLRKNNDIAIILELSASAGDFELVNQIIFTGKSVYNLYKKLKKTQGDNAEILHKQLARSADELKILLDKAISPEITEARKRFEETYFPNTSGALANLIDLSYDLSVLKDAQMQRNEFIKNSENDLQ